MATKVAILGTVPGSRAVAPYNDPDWDIWVCSPGNGLSATPPRVNVWFELHALVDCKGPENLNWWPNYVAWLRSVPFPVYMQERNNEVPRALPFPRRILLDKWGPSKEKGRRNWYTSSITWMCAFALYLSLEAEKQGRPFYDTIGIFGVDMASAEEHITGQKAALHRWSEIIHEHGRKYIVPLESTLAFDYPLYGYAEASRMGRHLTLREIELNQRVAQTEATIRRLEFDAVGMKSAIEEVRFQRRTYVSGLDDAEIDEEPLNTNLPIPAQPNLANFNPTGAVPGSESFVSHPSGLMVPATPVPARNVRVVPTASDFPDNPDAAELLPAKKANGAADGI